ncbi:hypothetical protein [Floricoccus penangensis]|uniref:hypothetical protein n=1 Tax=Floricoccus penangensis TaxID=1859475 RepID=UPI00203E0F72|nr:hypothetical protein [Floricoccus penangensis]URZ86622.1 hypothetical protein KIW23_05855 [Floricoccus penangensis]
MKKYLKLLPIIFIGILFLTACGNSKEDSKPKYDYTETQFEDKLNAGDDLTGKTVEVKVAKLVPNSAFGYNIEAGKHLNFVSPENPNVKEGDSVILKTEKVASTMGSYIITYKKVK